MCITLFFYINKCNENEMKIRAKTPNGKRPLQMCRYLNWLYLKIKLLHPQDFLFAVNKRFQTTTALSFNVVRRL